MRQLDQCAEVNGIRLRYRLMGDGPLAILMHGFPQHSYCFRYVQPLLAAQGYTVVAPDMRGYGLSDKPLEGYDKRTMAADIRALIEHLGFEQATLIAGHDRGARVAHRFGLDHPDAVKHLAMLDLIPSREVKVSFNFDVAKRYWHWFFHMNADLPEIFISSNLRPYIQMFFDNAYVRERCYEALDEYVESLERPGALRAALADYRQTFTTDLEQDNVDAEQGKKLEMPVLVLWGDKGLNADAQKMSDLWHRYAVNVRTGSVPDCGYYMAEEQPEALVEHLVAFVAAGGTEA